MTDVDAIKEMAAVLKALDDLEVEERKQHDLISDAVSTTSPEVLARANGVNFGVRHAVTVLRRAIEEA